MKPVTCMAFGYALLVMVMSQILPFTFPLTLTIAFFVPFMEKRRFLALALLQSAYTTLMTLIYRDALRAAFFGIDLFQLFGVSALILIFLLIGNMEAIDRVINHFNIPDFTPDSTILAVGIAAMLVVCFIIAAAENWIIVFLLRKVGFYRRIGKTCPKEWSIWRRLRT